MWWLEVRRSAAHESWIGVMANSLHRHSTVMDRVITALIVLACAAIMISPILGAWALLSRFDLRKFNNTKDQVKNGIDCSPVRISNDSEEAGIHVNKNAPLRRSLVRSVNE